MVHEVEITFDVEREGGGDFALVPSSLNVSDKGEDGIIGGGVRAATELIGRDEVELTGEECEAVCYDSF